jgi:hypothetical protein
MQHPEGLAPWAAARAGGVPVRSAARQRVPAQWCWARECPSHCGICPKQDGGAARPAPPASPQCCQAPLSQAVAGRGEPRWSLPPLAVQPGPTPSPLAGSSLSSAMVWVGPP